MNKLTKNAVFGASHCNILIFYIHFLTIYLHQLL